MHDFLDPNTWKDEPHEHRIYLNERDLDVHALVSEEDYQWAIQWRWKFKRSKRSTLLYAKRTTRDFHGGPTYDLYLHIEIMKRIEPTPPSDKHDLVDHWNGKSLDCRRTNLRWATFEMNMENRPSYRLLRETQLPCPI